MSDNESHSSMHRVVIVGGGTAGWLAAGILAAKLSANHTVTLIESPNIPSLGVGEGSWPSLRDTLLDIGISETVPTGYNELDIYTCWKSIAPNTSYEDVPQARRPSKLLRRTTPMCSITVTISTPQNLLSC